MTLPLPDADGLHLPDADGAPVHLPWAVRPHEVLVRLGRTPSVHDTSDWVLLESVPLLGADRAPVILGLAFGDAGIRNVQVTVPRRGWPVSAWVTELLVATYGPWTDHVPDNPRSYETGRGPCPA